MKLSTTVLLLQSGYTTISVVFDQLRNQEFLVYDKSIPRAVNQTSVPRPAPGSINRNNNQAYVYVVPTDTPIKVGNFVVVETSTMGIALAYVTEVHEKPQIDFDSDLDYKWIIQVVDPTSYHERMKAQCAFIEQVKNAEVAKKRKQLAQDLLSQFEEGSQERLAVERAMDIIKNPSTVAITQ